MVSFELAHSGLASFAWLSCYVMACIILVWVALHDAKTRIIPNRACFLLFVLGCLRILLEAQLYLRFESGKLSVNLKACYEALVELGLQSSFMEAFRAAGIVFVLLLFCVLLLKLLRRLRAMRTDCGSRYCHERRRASRELKQHECDIGGGDIKLLLALAFWLKLDILLLSLFVACCLVIVVQALGLLGRKIVRPRAFRNVSRAYPSSSVFWDQIKSAGSYVRSRQSLRSVSRRGTHWIKEKEKLQQKTCAFGPYLVFGVFSVFISGICFRCI